MSNAYDRITWRGVTLDRRTAAALEWAEKDGGITIWVSQGSYRPATSYSGTTHTGGGAVDIRCAMLTTRNRKRLVRALKRAGFAAWYRPATATWGAHIHAILRKHKNASNSAKWQVEQYDKRLSGLVSNGPDVSWRPKKPQRFNYKKRRPVDDI